VSSHAAASQSGSSRAVRSGGAGPLPRCKSHEGVFTACTTLTRRDQKGHPKRPRKRVPLSRCATFWEGLLADWRAPVVPGALRPVPDRRSQILRSGSRGRHGKVTCGSSQWTSWTARHLNTSAELLHTRSERLGSKLGRFLGCSGATSPRGGHKQPHQDATRW
jgi:hypothetical protein